MKAKGNLVREELVLRQVGVTQQHLDWLDARCISLPAFIRKCLDKAMDGKLKYY